MKGPVDERDLVIVLEKFEKHLLLSNVPEQKKGGARTGMPCLDAGRKAFCDAIAERGGAFPFEAKRIPTNRHSPQEVDLVVRDDYPAIVVKSARLQPAEAASLEVAASNPREDSNDKLVNSRSVSDQKVGFKHILSLRTGQSGGAHRFLG